MFFVHTSTIRRCTSSRPVSRSRSANLPDVCLGDTGLEGQVDLLDSILVEGDKPIVIDSAVLLADPEPVLLELCRRLGIPFEAAMLSWPPGPKPEDGVWAEHWYANTHRSTGFEASLPSDDPLPGELSQVLEAAQPLYDRLAGYAIRPA